MLILDKYGWPIERIHGHPISYLIRCLRFGRRVVSKAAWARRVDDLMNKEPTDG